MAEGKAWSEAKKIQVVSTWLMTGNCEMVSMVCKVPAQTIRLWRTKPWWKELEGVIKEEENLQASASLKKIIDKSLETVLDRLERGDWQYDPKTGELIRRPVLLRDAQKVAGEMIDRRELLKKVHTEKIAAPSVEESLKLIAAEFAKLATGAVHAVQSAQLQVGVPELPQLAAPKEEAIDAEFSSSESGADVGDAPADDGRGPQAGAEQGRDEQPEEPAVPITLGQPFFSPV